MTFNKKQMQPLIDKYQINPETNKLFISICEMFDGQPNYQLWAVKMIFSKTLTYDELAKIHDWVEKNQGMVKLLDKKNIVSYSTKSAIEQLMIEMESLDSLALIKNIISHFNTDQRKILTQAILPKDYTPLEAYSNGTVKHWAALLTKFSKLPMARKNNLYTVCSSIRTVGELEGQIVNALEKKYEWNKEDMIAYMENNTKGCEIVFNQGPYVIIRVGNFDASKKLCGGGRTQWCLTKNESYFRDYAGSDNRDQYFYFDFSRKETDCFAHIGFTIENGRGVLYAQTCDNRDMRVDFVQGEERTNFNKIMQNAGVKMSIFMRLKEKCKFSWDIASVIDMAKGAPDSYAIAFDGDNKLVINVLSNDGFDKLVGHTFVNKGKFPIDSNYKVYIVLDFNQELNDEKSILTIGYKKDQYGCLSLTRIMDIFGNDMTKSGYLGQIGLSSEDFLNREAIDPKILIHKYIDENDELAAIKLIEKEGKNFDVNYQFNQRIPIFSAINNKMYKLFDKIVNHPKWDSTIEDGFGETLLESLMYLHGSEEISQSTEDNKNLVTMITSLLNSRIVDFNSKDLNNDTAINIACEFPKMTWIVKALASRRNVDVNVVNDFESTSLTNCIRSKNLEALKIIGMRPDIKVSEIDKKLAKKMGINLSDYIKPSESVFNDNSLVASEDEVLEASMVEA